ncbi:MAG: radical SAM protein, partial [Nanoarchaeota archaeon]
DYLEFTIHKLKDALRGVSISHIYIGGGTPSILQNHQIERLLNLLFSNFSIHEKGERIFECHPHSMSEEKVATFAKYGCTRITFGVQTTQPKLLVSHNREYQNWQQIKNLMDATKKHGIKERNADLMFGLQHQSIKDVMTSIKKLLDEDIEYVTIYRTNFGKYSEKREKMLTLFGKDLLEQIDSELDRSKYMPIGVYEPETSAIMLAKNSNYYAIKSFSVESLLKIRPSDYFGIGPENSHYEYPSFLPTSLLGIGPGAYSSIFMDSEFTMLLPENEKTTEGNPIDKLHIYSKKFFSKDDSKVIAEGKDITIETEIMKMLSVQLKTKNTIDLLEIYYKYGTEIYISTVRIIKEIMPKALQNHNSTIEVGSTFEEKWYFMLSFLQKYRELYG